MTRADIIRMAREAGAHEKHLVMYMDFDDLERFAALVAAAEREACANVCEESAAILDAPSLYMGGPSNTAKRKAQQFADAIRARSTP